MSADPVLSSSDFVEQSQPVVLRRVWRTREAFGLWIRDLRVRAGPSIKEAAAALQVSYARLQKLETGAVVRAPSSELLLRMAQLYGQDPVLMLERGGFDLCISEEVRQVLRCDDAFAALMLHPALRPESIEPRFLLAYSRLQKAQVIELARKLEAHVLAGGAPVAELLRGAAEEGA